MRCTGYTSLFASRRSAVIGAFQSSFFGQEIVFSAPCCLTLYLFPVMFLDGGHPPSENCDSVIPVDVILVKLYKDSSSTSQVHQ